MTIAGAIFGTDDFKVKLVKCLIILEIDVKTLLDQICEIKFQ